MVHLFKRQPACLRVLLFFLALFAVPLSLSVYGQTETPYKVVFSNSNSFDKTVEVPMVAALYRGGADGDETHPPPEGQQPLADQSEI